MGRVLFHLRLYPGTETAFDGAHDPLPQDLVEAVREAGLQNVSAFRRGTDVWFYAEADGDARAAFDRFVRTEPHARWSGSLAAVVIDPRASGGPTIYEEIFHSDGPAITGGFERGVFVLVVHPERIAEYDERHAEPWPDMMQALSDSGFRNYSGFRDGSLVLYYGQFDPDMVTATATIGATDVNRRWGESFEGIITTITDDEGRLFTAREVLHID
jgi:L-rhamnose mutarotase